MEHSNKVINFKLFDRTNGPSKFVTDLLNYQRPPYEFLSETLKGAGIMGEIDAPTWGQLASMPGAMTFKNSNQQTEELFAPGIHEVEVRWATDKIDSSTGKAGVVAHKEIIRYMAKKLDRGQIESNAANENSLSYEVIYCKYIVDRKTVSEIDKLNEVCIINGIDYYKQIRDAL